MRRTIACLVLLAAQQAWAAPPLPPARYEVPEDKGPQEIQQFVRDIPVGGDSGWHRHPGAEMGYVLAGETEVRLADGTVGRFETGEFFSIPRGVVHNGVNVGKQPLRLLVTYVIDRGAPTRTDAPDPRARR